MKLKKFKKIVFLVFGSNHRISALGNFGKSKMYKDILLIYSLLNYKLVKCDSSQIYNLLIHCK